MAVCWGWCAVASDGGNFVGLDVVVSEEELAGPAHVVFVVVRSARISVVG